MIKYINSVLITISITIICAYSWNVKINAQEVEISSFGICEYKIGQDGATIRDKFEKVTVYSEDGETYKYRGNVCNSSILSEFEINEGLISKISVIDEGFCNHRICIGTPFEEVKILLPDSRLYFSGEEGGVFSLEDANGLSYVFSMEDLDISCFINQEKCMDKINKAKLIALVI